MARKSSAAFSLPKTLKDLRPAAYNPRVLSISASQGLEFSLKEFGDLSGLTFNVRTGNLVTGHQRQTKLPPDAPIVDYREARDDVGTIGYGFVEVGKRRYSLRFVDWDETREKAANITANNPAIQGGFNALLNELLQEIESSTPDVYDQAMLAKLLDTGKGGVDDDNEEAGEYDLSPHPYESYNYVVLLFRNDVDWTAAVDHFKLKKVRESNIKKSRVGLGHAIDGADYLNRIRQVKK
jgi:hypothetical protein